MADKQFPQTHLGHHIGPAPTSEELGISRKGLPKSECQHGIQICTIVDGKEVWTCDDCGEVRHDND